VLFRSRSTGACIRGRVSLPGSEIRLRMAFRVPG